MPWYDTVLKARFNMLHQLQSTAYEALVNEAEALVNEAVRKQHHTDTPYFTFKLERNLKYQYCIKEAIHLYL